LNLLERVGSYAGLAAFLGLAVLVLLYFSQARDVRRLRDWAGRAPERAGETTAQTPAARHGLPPLTLAEHESRPRKRLRERIRKINLPNLRYVGAALGLLLLLGGAAYAAVQLADNSGGGGSTSDASGHQRAGGGSGSKKNRSRINVNPADITVAVLNGTAVQGLAAKVGDEVRANGFNPGTIGNAARIDQTRSVVLYAPGQQRAARAVANRLGIKTVAPADAVNREIAGSFDALVLVGSDRGG
jgi:LytR cell envelope-related transcriptional attenuator